MLKVGQIERTEITGYSSEGMGVCRVNGCAVFVPNAIRGELCTVKITHVSRSSAHGKIEEILKRSPHRISRSCPVAKLCGGCQYHHMDYQEELYAKARKVTDALNRLGGQSLQTVTITGGDGTRWETQGTGNREQGTGTEETDSSTALRSAQNDGSEGSNSLISSVNAGGNAAAVPAAEASGDASLRGEPVPAAVYAYRNKAQYPVSERNGKPVAGFYKNRTHEVIPVARCAILPEIFDQVRDVVIRWAEEDRVSVYDERTGRGLLRHIYVRRGAVSGQVMVCLAVNGERLPREKRLVHALQRDIPGLSSVVLSVNTKNTNVVLGDSFRTLWGRDWIEDELCGFTFRLSPRSFYQVNHDQAQRLYEKAVELAELHGTETVLDLYCGTGTITLALSRKAGRAVGVEVVPEAIEDAKENAARNGVENVEFFCADASAAAERLCAEGAAPDVIVVDPPRKGLAPEVIDAMAQMAPRRIVYVSCDPATLARDVKLLTDRGYALTHAEAFDLFPRTFHVETVVQLVRKNPDMTVSVTLNLEDADLTASEAKATYEQIKAYVLETYGLRVTSLQIAQTKRKLGLPTGEHYNLSQKENQVIPHCPPEKESAIRESLRIFRMI
ncbi:MAG: 23S rRNA (uracil(1939)-C(5))-methyltransferase RlmD [Oscillospiraceae bacterium]|nr:23S rRNA (uracil(1939)-C(5))-methyltransferase RlmD [Oscillospiraceae bacterium]